MEINPLVHARRQYTEPEIRELSPYLPGFDSPADANEIFADPFALDNLWQPVLSATVVTSFEDRIHVLTGKRTSEGNTTHANVASTPTMRIPSQHAAFFVMDKAMFCLEGKIDPLNPFVSESATPNRTVIPESTDVLAAPIASLLAMKLDLGDIIDWTNKPIGRVSLARHIVGFSYLEDNESGEPLYEPLVMFGAVVGLAPQLVDHIPDQTRSYSNLGWTPIEQYVRGVKAKSVTEVIPSARPGDELEVCVRGLCNATSTAIVTNPYEIMRHLVDDIKL